MNVMGSSHCHENQKTKKKKKKKKKKIDKMEMKNRKQKCYSCGQDLFFIATYCFSDQLFNYMSPLLVMPRMSWEVVSAKTTKQNGQMGNEKHQCDRGPSTETVMLKLDKSATFQK